MSDFCIHCRNCGRVVRIAGILLLLTSTASGQSKSSDRDKTRREEPTGQELATRLTKAEESLLKEYLDVADTFYRQGDRDSAIDVLQKVMHIAPKRADIQQRMDSIREEMMQENGLRTELDVSKSWLPVCEVEEGKPFRLTATGDYKLDYTTTVPVTGLSTANPQTDHIAAAPFGALIGVILTDGKPGEPFAVNATLEHKPKKGGQLYLRVNVPAAAKCKGELKLQLSGGVQPLEKKR